MDTIWGEENIKPSLEKIVERVEKAASQVIGEYNATVENEFSSNVDQDDAVVELCAAIDALKAYLD